MARGGEVIHSKDSDTAAYGDGISGGVTMVIGMGDA